MAFAISDLVHPESRLVKTGNALAEQLAPLIRVAGDDLDRFLRDKALQSDDPEQIDDLFRSKTFEFFRGLYQVRRLREFIKSERKTVKDPAVDDCYDLIQEAWSVSTIKDSYDELSGKLIPSVGAVVEAFQEGDLRVLKRALNYPSSTRPPMRSLRSLFASLYFLEHYEASSELDYRVFDHRDSRTARERALEIVGSESKSLLLKYLRVHGEMSVRDRWRYLATILWGYSRVLSSSDVRDPGLEEDLWPLLEQLERLGTLSELRAKATTKEYLHVITSEAHCLWCLLSLGRELKVRRDLFKSWHPVGRSGDDLWKILEVGEFVKEILSARVAAFVAAIDSILDDGEDSIWPPEKFLYERAYALRVLLMYRQVYLLPLITKMEKVVGCLNSQRPLKINVENGMHFPPQPSARWETYREQFKDVRKKVALYQKKALAIADAAQGSVGSPTKLKPLVILVVGEPGTGKSAFVNQIEDALAGVTGAIPRTVCANLSQMSSVAGELPFTWRELVKTRSQGVRLLILDEFDVRIGQEADQYRRVLAPLWDGKLEGISNQIVGTDTIVDERRDHLILGPFVAVCVMSSVSSLAQARRMLSGIGKGRDFLSRVDVVVEIPGFDSAHCQLNLAICALMNEFESSKTERTSMLVCGRTLLLLGWLEAEDHFRSIAKALKTVQWHERGEKPIEHTELNIPPRIKSEFRWVMEEVQFTEGDWPNHFRVERDKDKQGILCEPVTSDD